MSTDIVHYEESKSLTPEPMEQPVFPLDVYRTCLGLHTQFCRANEMSNLSTSFFACANFKTSAAGNIYSFDMRIQQEVVGMAGRMKVSVEFFNNSTGTIAQSIFAIITNNGGIEKLLMQPGSDEPFPFFPELLSTSGDLDHRRNLALSTICMRAKIEAQSV